MLQVLLGVALTLIVSLIAREVWEHVPYATRILMQRATKRSTDPSALTEWPARLERFGQRRLSALGWSLGLQVYVRRQTFTVWMRKALAVLISVCLALVPQPEKAPVVGR